MPPKAPPSESTIIKFKRKSDTYVIPIVLIKSSLIRESLITPLVSAINGSGGLLMEENASLEGLLGTAVAAEELLLALPKTRESTYENDWIEITDEELLRGSTIGDYNVLAFKHIDDADFHISKPEYVDQD